MGLKGYALVRKDEAEDARAGFAAAQRVSTLSAQPQQVIAARSIKRAKPCFFCTPLSNEFGSPAGAVWATCSGARRRNAGGSRVRSTG